MPFKPDITLEELDAALRDYLNIAAFPNDPSINGLQVERSGGGAIRRMAFAVDACAETIRRAASWGADALFVHHGLFWGDCAPVRGILYRRLSALIQSNTALFACHLPLDAHPECGNNYGIARRLGLTGLRPFGEWRGHTIGAVGALPSPLSPEEIIEAAFPASRGSAAVLPFGKERAETVAVISGGGGGETAQAAEAGADLFLTGEIKHEHYHTAEELGITVIACGHYATETVGPELLRRAIEQETGIATCFIDAPTGL